jgi:hypothetical protein
VPVGTDPENLPWLGQGHEGIHKTLHYSLTRLSGTFLGTGEEGLTISVI